MHSKINDVNHVVLKINDVNYESITKNTNPSEWHFLQKKKSN
jgi:hypothetical protein